MAKNKFATAKLDWAKKWLSKMEAYLEKNPYDTVEDRITLKERKDGGVMPITSATIEQIHKDQRDTMRDYLDLLDVVKRMESDEDAEKGTSTYGGTKVSPRMKNYGDKEEEDT